MKGKVLSLMLLFSEWDRPIAWAIPNAPTQRLLYATLMLGINTKVYFPTMRNVMQNLPCQNIFNPLLLWPLPNLPRFC